jgi:hypothetical protein
MERGGADVQGAYTREKLPIFEEFLPTIEAQRRWTDWNIKLLRQILQINTDKRE